MRKLFSRNKLLIKLSIPIFIELILNILIGYVDQFVVISNPDVYNGILQCVNITNVFFIAFSVLSSSSIIIISQFHGSKNKEDEKKVYALAFYFNLIIGIIISLVLFFLAEVLLRGVNVDEAVLPYAIKYLKITGIFVFTNALSSVLSAFLRANKFNVSSTIITLIMNILNIGLDLLFYFPLNMGIEGVAFASSISRLIGLIIMFVVLYKRIKISLSPKLLFPFPKEIFKSLIKIGLPSAGESLSYWMSQVVVMLILNTFSSTLDTNLKGFITSCSMIVYLFASGTSQAMQVMEGEYLGAKNPKKADKLVKDTIKMSLIVSFISYCVLLAAGYPLINLCFGQEYLKVGMIVLCIDFLLEIGRTCNLVYVRALQTTGDVYFPVISSIISCWVVAVFGSFVFNYFFSLGVIGCWIAMTLDENIRAWIFSIRWKKGGWKKLDIVDNTNSK